jgi:helicase required for RNAi-mediated heterochromatin assembly 1
VQACSENALEQWLGKYLMPCDRPIKPDNFGVAYEEEDFDDVEQLEELEAEAVARDDDDIEALKGPVTSLSDNWTAGDDTLSSKTDDDVRALLFCATNLGSITGADRARVYNLLLSETKRYITARFRVLAAEYEKIVLERKIGQWEEDQRLLTHSRIVGM